jgi:uncharacterized membrane protein
LKRAGPFVAVASLAAVLLAVASVFKHHRFGSHGYDLGIFDQTIWGYSHFEITTNTVKRVPILLGDHFHPILFTLAPLYWIWNDAGVLLVAQAVLLAVSSLPLAFWARTAIGSVGALAIQACYLVFWGLLAGALFDFHELAFAPVAISLALYGVVRRDNRALLAGVAIGLATKEELALTMLTVGLYVALVQGRRRLGLAVAAGSAIWFVVVVWLVMPALANRPFGYWSYALEPTHLAEKLGTAAAFFGPWLALPVLSPLLLVAIPTLAEKLFSTTPSHWSTHFHYGLVAAPILGFASVDALARIKARRPSIVLPIAAAVAFAGAFVTFVVVKPLRPLTSLVSERRAEEIQSCLATISPGSSVSATNALIPHLTHRREIYPVYVGRQTRYIAIDTSTSLASLTPSGVQEIVHHSLNNGYRVRCRRGATLVLSR